MTSGWSRAPSLLRPAGFGDQESRSTEMKSRGCECGQISWLSTTRQDSWVHMAFRIGQTAHDNKQAL